MGRASVWLLLFFVFTAAGGAMIQDTGVAEDMGITGELGAPEELEPAREDAKCSETKSVRKKASCIDSSGGFGDTLYGLYQSLGGGLTAIFGAINPSIGMLVNLGIPEEIIGYATAGMAIITGLDVVSFLSGRDLI